MMYVLAVVCGMVGLVMLVTGFGSALDGDPSQFMAGTVLLVTAAHYAFSGQVSAFLRELRGGKEKAETD